MAVELNIVLSAELSGSKAICLSWTAEQNANFEVFWKSNVPAGQEYALLVSTNAFEYTTADLEPTKIYQFYVRGWIGEQFFVSNAVELFVSCGKGVVLTGGDTDEPPCQLAVVGRVKYADMSTPVTGTTSNFAQDPTNKDAFYFLEKFGLSPFDYRLWKFVWPTQVTLVATITDTGNTIQNVNSSIQPAIAYNPSSGHYHICFLFYYTVYGSSYSDSVLVDVDLTTGTISKNTNYIPGISCSRIFYYTSGVHLYFCFTGNHTESFVSYDYAMRKEAGSAVANYFTVRLTGGYTIWCPLPGTGQFLERNNVEYRNVNFETLSSSVFGGTPPPIDDISAGGHPMNLISEGNLNFRFATSFDPTKRNFVVYNSQTGESQYVVTDDIAVGSTPAHGFDLYKKTDYYLMAHVKASAKGTLISGKMIVSPALTIYSPRTMVVDGGTPTILDIFYKYPYIYVNHYGGDNGPCITKICNGVG